jgi:hypothetical protein
MSYDDDKNEESEMWAEHNEAMKKMRNKRRDKFFETIKEFERLGFEIRRLTPFQYRINECLDIYPSNKRYHDLKTGQRGDIRGISYGDFLRKYFGLK